MKNIIFIFTLIITIIYTSNVIAGDRYKLPKNIPTEIGVDAQYFEIASVQLIPHNNDSLTIKFVLAIFATESAKKELGFGQYEIIVASETKENIEQLIFPILINTISKPE